MALSLKSQGSAHLCTLSLVACGSLALAACGGGGGGGGGGPPANRAPTLNAIGPQNMAEGATGRLYRNSGIGYAQFVGYVRPSLYAAS